MSTYLKNLLDDDKCNDVACEVIDSILKLPNAHTALMSCIPDDWEYSCSESGDNPTKRQFLFQFIWNELNKGDNDE